MRTVRFQRGLWFTLCLAAVLVPALSAGAWQNAPASNQPAAGPATEGSGLIRNAPGAYQGYTLISPMTSTSVFLVDMQGRVVHSWETSLLPGAFGYLLENGQLLRSGAQPNSPFGGTVA